MTTYQPNTQQVPSNQVLLVVHQPTLGHRLPRFSSTRAYLNRGAQVGCWVLACTLSTLPRSSSTVFLQTILTAPSTPAKTWLLMAGPTRPPPCTPCRPCSTM
ncbi:uncharacterized protein LOC135104042 isoform X3 [Scylla paramamosain]|uniref:uncharacterized protein LOC135104042 isoform X3 n=1 Tax=Scylla paramamosain TaxID=85552 RepID=UPI0030833FC8